MSPARRSSSIPAQSGSGAAGLGQGEPRQGLARRCSRRRPAASALAIQSGRADTPPSAPTSPGLSGAADRQKKTRW
ncbi:hypothetical protein M8494_11245 [Serratia ureilytica]